MRRCDQLVEVGRRQFFSGSATAAAAAVATGRALAPTNHLAEALAHTAPPPDQEITG